VNIFNNITVGRQCHPTVISSSVKSSNEVVGGAEAAAMNVNEFSSPNRAKILVSGVISGAISFEEADLSLC